MAKTLTPDIAEGKSLNQKTFMQKLLVLMPGIQFQLLALIRGFSTLNDPSYYPGTGSEFFLSPTHEFPRLRNTQRSTYLTPATEVVGCVYLSSD